MGCRTHCETTPDCGTTLYILAPSEDISHCRVHLRMLCQEGVSQRVLVVKVEEEVCSFSVDFDLLIIPLFSYFSSRHAPLYAISCVAVVVFDLHLSFLQRYR